MPSKIIAAYDGTPHALDAVALARLLAVATGGQLMLAHVHRADPQRSPSQAASSGRQAFLRNQGERLLAAARELVGDIAVELRAVASTTTATGLRILAESERAAVIVFGSAVAGPAGYVHPGSAARRLLQSAPTAVAVAPAGYAARDGLALAPTFAARDDQEGSAARTGRALAQTTTGELFYDAGAAGLIVVGARPSALPGHVMTDGTAERLIQSATVPVLVLARGVALETALATARAA
jgi:nucleotide-binding universal stress UspA family protein